MMRFLAVPAALFAVISANAQPAAPAAAPSSRALSGLTCPRATSCWAVGDQIKAGVTRTLIEHWNGRKWSVVPTRAAGRYSSLSAVFCRRDTNCWAVGSAFPFGLAEHWNGRRWSAAPTPRTGGGLAGVWCPGRDCFATGISGYPSGIAERWNGRKWSLTLTAPLPQGTISALPGVSCARPVNCFTVGVQNDQTLIERWRGSKWMKVKSPNPAGSAALHSVYCLSLAACWAVGVSDKQGFGGGPESTMAAHWNGKRWSIVRTPS